MINGFNHHHQSPQDSKFVGQPVCDRGSGLSFRLALPALHSPGDPTFCQMANPIYPYFQSTLWWDHVPSHYGSFLLNYSHSSFRSTDIWDHKKTGTKSLDEDSSPAYFLLQRFGLGLRLQRGESPALKAVEDFISLMLCSTFINLIRKTRSKTQPKYNF